MYHADIITVNLDGGAAHGIWRDTDFTSNRQEICPSLHNPTEPVIVTCEFDPPRPLAVETRRGTARPARLSWRGGLRRIVRIEEEWEQVWWSAGPMEIRRRYYRVALADGTICVIYRDARAGGWFLAGIVD